MKILSTSQIREADAYTIKYEPVTSINLMERAASACASWIAERYGDGAAFYIFCGTGNNGGDGLAIARILNNTKYYNIKVFAVRHSDKTSPDFSTNLSQLAKSKNVDIVDITEKTTLPELPENTVIIDALLGSGLSKPITGLLADVVDHINKSKAETIISIDIPTGLFAEDNSANTGKVIQADYTLTFELPKLAFLFPENAPFVGEWQVLPIGLSKEFIAQANTNYHYITEELILPLLKKRDKFSHKGTFGHALIVAGSKGKMGAAVMAAKAALRAGSGLVSAHIPNCGYTVLQSSVPEAMCETDANETHISGRIKTGNCNALAVGPGIGNDPDTVRALKLLIQDTTINTVFDADALNIIAENKTWFPFMRGGSILTPHPKEFERLFGKSDNSFERLKLQREMAMKYGFYIVLKDAHTSIAFPDGSVYFNSTGNPGMATGGSGDVLTGIICGLLAQGYKPYEASVLGVYLHGIAGDVAAEKMSEQGMTAMDIIEGMGEAWKKVGSKQ
ncbi:MAG: NAD(P)H-hydrate dehydratase [Bacteroidia bacterium]